MVFMNNFGLGVKKNIEASMCVCMRLQTMVGSGDTDTSADALYWMSLIHFDGIGGIPKDRIKYHDLILLSAEQGCAGAQCNLGFCYEMGEYGFPKDLKESLKWYQQAAQHNFFEWWGGVIKDAQSDVNRISIEMRSQ
jgi:TPR repeat protein